MTGFRMGYSERREREHEPYAVCYRALEIGQKQFWLYRAFKAMFNGLIESSDGQLYGEFLNIHKFVALHHAPEKLRA